MAADGADNNDDGADCIFRTCIVCSADRSESVLLTVYVPPDAPKVTPVVMTTTAGLLTTISCVSRGGRPPPEVRDSKS